MNLSPIHVHLVAPSLMCWGLQRLVQTAGSPFILTGSSMTLEEAASIVERQLPDVLALDFDDNYSVADIEDVHARLRVKVLVLIGNTDESLPARLLEAGARGVLQKREAPASLLKALEAVGNGEIFATRQTTERMFVTAVQNLPREEHQPLDRMAALTGKERQTIDAVTSDASAPVKVIASRMCISEHTLRNHLTSIYSKLGDSGRLSLYAYVNQHGHQNRH